MKFSCYSCRWLKDGVDVTANAADPVHHRHTLILDSLEESEMGVYTCAAKNNHGEVCKKE